MDSDDAEDDKKRENDVNREDGYDNQSEYHEVKGPQKLAEWILFKGTLEEGKKTISQDF